MALCWHLPFKISTIIMYLAAQSALIKMSARVFYIRASHSTLYVQPPYPIIVPQCPIISAIYIGRFAVWDPGHRYKMHSAAMYEARRFTPCNYILTNICGCLKSRHVGQPGICSSLSFMTPWVAFAHFRQCFLQSNATCPLASVSEVVFSLKTKVTCPAEKLPFSLDDK